MKKKIYKYGNRLQVTYEEQVCKDVFLFSVIENRTMQAIQHEAMKEWLKRKKAEREKMRDRLAAIDND